MIKKRGQIGIEYMVVMGFIVFIILGILGIGFYYMGITNEQMILSQIDNFAKKVISTAERVYYEGSPSKATIEVYLPEQVDNISIIDNNLVVTFQTREGESISAFKSNVPINGTISSNSGVRKIIITAKENYVEISSS